jgi:protein-S-isoprenylcysteine O-methyltransferase Ste14
VTVDTYGPLLPFAFVLLCLWTVVRHGALRFLGISQLVASANHTDEIGVFTAGASPRLVTTGTYGIVRHPMYAYLLAAAVVRPVLSLDLLIWFLCAAVVLAIAIPLEEEKLIAIFGAQYREYQRRTPAFVPFWPASR